MPARKETAKERDQRQAHALGCRLVLEANNAFRSAIDGPTDRFTQSASEAQKILTKLWAEVTSAKEAAP